MIRSMRMRLAGHEAHIGAKRNADGKYRYRWEDKTKWILETQDGLVWTGLIWLRIGTSEGLL
jgi:hypothetical protein